MRRTRHTQRGIGLVEVVFGSAIIAVTLVGLISAFVLYVRVGLAQVEHTQATYLAEEGIEAARFLRDEAWGDFASLTVGATYHLAYVEATGWEATSTPQTHLDRFTREFTVRDVYRDNATQDIVPDGSSGSVDGDAREVEVRITWGSEPEEVVLRTYLTNIHE